MKVRGGEAHIEILNLRNVKNFNAQCEAVKEEVQPLLNAVPLNMLKLFPSEAGDQHLPFNMDLCADGFANFGHIRLPTLR